VNSPESKIPGYAPEYSSGNKTPAYVPATGKKYSVVVDGQEQKPYDAIVNTGGGKLLFDSPDSFHYLAVNGDNIYLVEETLKPQ
jgi:hypothetical protein